MVKFPLIRRQKTRCSYNLKECLIIPLSSFCAVKQKKKSYKDQGVIYSILTLHYTFISVYFAFFH